MIQHLGTILAVCVVLVGIILILLVRAILGRRGDNLPFQKDTRNLEEEERDFYTGKHFHGRYSQFDILGHIRDRLNLLRTPGDDEQRRYILDTRLHNVEMLLDYISTRFSVTPDPVDDVSIAEIDASHPLVTDLERKPTQYGAGAMVMIRNSLKAKLHAWIAERRS